MKNMQHLGKPATGEEKSGVYIIDDTAFIGTPAQQQVPMPTITSGDVVRQQNITEMTP